MQCKSLRFALAALLAAPAAVFATNGYFPIGFGPRTQAMGGAGIAFPQDGNAAGANPAGMAHVPDQFNMSMAAFIPPRRVAAEGQAQFGFQTPDANSPVADAQSSNHNGFPFPGMGGAIQLSDRLSFGVTVVGAGANTDYDQNFFDLTGNSPEARGNLGVQYFQMQLLPTLAYRISEQNTIGASLAVAAHTFRAYGLQNFGTPGTLADFQFSTDDSNLTNKGPDWGYGLGLRLGWLGHYFEDTFNVGAYVASPVYMTKFNRYAGLFANEGEFNVPPHLGVGFAVRPTDRFAVAMDIQKIYYSSVDAIGNPHPTTSIQDPCVKPIDTVTTCTTPGAVDQTTANALGGPQSWGFGWRDQTVYKIGATFQLTRKWDIMAGWNYGKSPIPDNQLLFSMLAPAVTEHHVTFGAAYDLARAFEIQFMLEYAFKNSQVCEAPTCVTMFTQNPGDYVAAELEILVVGAGFAYKF